VETTPNQVAYQIQIRLLIKTHYAHMDKHVCTYL